jgi:tRNA(Ser,Leu) C12 N-acetylase TAN1
MQDWNVVISVREGGYSAARDLLRDFAVVGRTHYFNVLVAKVADPLALLQMLSELSTTVPDIPNFLARVVPLGVTFNFESAEQFETQARDAVLQWASQLAGKSFHVRVHRRGFKAELPSPKEEFMLAEVLLEATQKAGSPATISFDDPDAIIAVETVDNRAGLSLWSREDLRRYPLLGLD